MTEPTLITICKSRSGIDLKLGPESEWNRIRAKFADLDYIDMYCVMEYLEYRVHLGEPILPVWEHDLEAMQKMVTHHVSSHWHLAQILPPSLDRARIARSLLKDVLGL